MLESAHAKVARARDQLQELEIEFRQFSASKPYTIRQEHELETERFILVYYPDAPIPNSWAVRIGEIFYDCRSALDHAVYELSILEQGVSIKNSEFPIFSDPVIFAERKNNGDPTARSGLYKIRGLRQETQSFIEALQPYNIPIADKISILLVLHEMNIRDKHQELFLCRGLSGRTLIKPVRSYPAHFNLTVDTWRSSLDEKTILAWLKLPSGLDDKVYMDADLVFEITFDKSCCSAFQAQHGVIATIIDVIKGVDRILHHLKSSITG